MVLRPVSGRPPTQGVRSRCLGPLTTPPDSAPARKVSLPESPYVRSIEVLGAVEYPHLVMAIVVSVRMALRSLVRSRAALHLEILARRHQVRVLARARRPCVRLTAADRVPWVWLARVWTDGRRALVLVPPDTVIAWHRRGFRLFWTWKSRRRTGRPSVPAAVRALIRTLADANPLWGAPRIHGELRKLGLNVSQSTVATYLGRRRPSPSQTWRTCLATHIEQIVAADFFVVPTVTYRWLFVLVLLAHERRRVVHVAVTEHPTSAWTAPPLRNAFPHQTSPSYLLHDRDTVFGGVAATIAAMQGQRVLTAPRSPWQNASVERFIGSIRRACLDHRIVWHAAGLQRGVTSYVAYYRRSRTHVGLGKDAPTPRPVMSAATGHIIARPEVHGLHHRDDRAAASSGSHVIVPGPLRCHTTANGQ